MASNRPIASKYSGNTGKEVIVLHIFYIFDLVLWNCSEHIPLASSYLILKIEANPWPYYTRLIFKIHFIPEAYFKRIELNTNRRSGNK